MWSILVSVSWNWNDYDVHTALILAPSYAKTIDEKYYQQDKNVPLSSAYSVQYGTVVVRPCAAVDAAVPGSIPMRSPMAAAVL